MLRWKDEYLTGIDIIDEQHKELFRIAEQAFELLKNDFYIDKYDRIVNLIEQLKNYASFHFETEENYMTQIGYQRLLHQKVQHHDFVEKVNQINLEEVDENQDQSLLFIIEFAVDWIDQHILKEDKRIPAE
ncbi:bacteriohemerythrin [Garciella nitratireducens]|uniref:Hemerythrin n=1 Tax=Garciella nitratireducens DSM 15102 TaxID=1121911 RepID=A0A1T4NQP9_9FIRM|nr:hemerythrin family protein [Garciella nitratireducens]SJZ81522.1 hemerythrin [Garciella nitratireducens DSM 15102]